MDLDENLGEKMGLLGLGRVTSSPECRSSLYNVYVLRSAEQIVHR